MNNKAMKIWIWLQDNELVKAIYNPTDQTLTVCNEHDEILLKRKGVSVEQMVRIEIVFSAMGAKRVDGHKEPFTYL